MRAMLLSLSFFATLGLATALPAALGSHVTKSKTLRTLATERIEKGSLTVKARRVSSRRIRVTIIFVVKARSDTEGAFTAWACRRIRGGVTCPESDKIGVAYPLRAGSSRLTRTVIATRRHARRAHCVFGQAHEGPRGRILHPERNGTQVC